MKHPLSLLAAAALLSLAGAAEAKNFCDGLEPTACVNTMNPQLSERIREKAKQGPDALRQFIYRTRQIHMLDYVDVAGAWYTEKSTYLASRDAATNLACRDGNQTAC